MKNFYISVGIIRIQQELVRRNPDQADQLSNLARSFRNNWKNLAPYVVKHFNNTVRNSTLAKAFFIKTAANFPRFVNIVSKPGKNIFLKFTAVMNVKVLHFK